METKGTIYSKRLEILGDWKGGEVGLGHRDWRHLSGLLVTLT